MQKKVLFASVIGLALIISSYFFLFQGLFGITGNIVSQDNFETSTCATFTTFTQGFEDGTYGDMTFTYGVGRIIDLGSAPEGSKVLALPYNNGYSANKIVTIGPNGGTLSFYWMSPTEISGDGAKAELYIDDVLILTNQVYREWKKETVSLTEGDHEIKWRQITQHHNALLDEIVITNSLENYPCPITNCIGLQNMKDDLTANYTLGNNIDCSDTINWNDGNGFEPIGNPFTGNFDGNGFSISNLYINNVGEAENTYVGLFGTAKGSSIGNVSLLNVNVTSKEAGAGALVGSGNNVTIYSVYTSGLVKAKMYVGGIIGLGLTHNGPTKIEESKSDCVVIGDNNVGGLAGLFYGPIDNSYSTGNIFGGYRVGGLVGYSPKIRNSYSTGDVSVENSNRGTIWWVGGLEGLAGDVENSYTTGKVLLSSLDGRAHHGVSALTGGRIGGSFEFINLDIINSYWVSQDNGVSGCYRTFNSQYLEGEYEETDIIFDDGCTEIGSSDIDHFNYPANEPQNSWDFDNIWGKTGDLNDNPCLLWEEGCQEISKANIISPYGAYDFVNTYLTLQNGLNNIRILEPITVKGECLDCDLLFTENMISINTGLERLEGFNKSSIITFGNVNFPIEYLEDVKLMKDGIEISKDKIEIISTEPFTFKVSGFTNWSIETCFDNDGDFYYPETSVCNNPLNSGEYNCGAGEDLCIDFYCPFDSSALSGGCSGTISDGRFDCNDDPLGPDGINGTIDDGENYHPYSEIIECNEDHDCDGIPYTHIDCKNVSSLSVVTMGELPLGAGNVNLSWDNPLFYEDETPLIGIGRINIYVGIEPGNYTQNFSTPTSGSQGSYLLGGLEMGQTYYVAVTAVDLEGMESDYSNEISLMATGSSGITAHHPSLPSEINSMIAVGGNIHLKWGVPWDASPSKQYIYDIYKSNNLLLGEAGWVKIGTLIAESTSPLEFLDSISTGVAFYRLIRVGSFSNSLEGSTGSSLISAMDSTTGTDLASSSSNNGDSNETNPLSNIVSNLQEFFKEEDNRKMILIVIGAIATILVIIITTTIVLLMVREKKHPKDNLPGQSGPKE
jgi:hypothetical protein